LADPEVAGSPGRGGSPEVAPQLGQRWLDDSERWLPRGGSRSPELAPEAESSSGQCEDSRQFNKCS